MISRWHQLSNIFGPSGSTMRVSYKAKLSILEWIKGGDQRRGINTLYKPWREKKENSLYFFSISNRNSPIVAECECFAQNILLAE